jgi:hypothetical protein
MCEMRQDCSFERSYFMNDEQIHDEQVELEPFVISEELQKVADAALTDIHNRSFSGRHPELGKMINCPVCGLRHRGMQCEPHYMELYVEEDLETGKQTPVYAMASQTTRKGVAGAKAFAKQRLKPHLNKYKRQFVERVRQLIGEGTFDLQSKEFEATLKIARTLAARQLKRERIERANVQRQMQDVSRRINWGLLPAGSR